MTILPYLVAVWLLVVGLWGVITSRHLVHMVLCLSVVQGSTYVLLLAVGYRTGAWSASISRSTRSAEASPCSWPRSPCPRCC